MLAAILAARRVEHQEEQILRLEAEIYVLKAGKVSDELGRGDYEHQGDGHLGRDEAA